MTRAVSSKNTLASSSNKANVSTAALASSSLRPPLSARDVVNLRSVPSLYAGMAGPLLASGAIRSFNFAVFDAVRRGMFHGDATHYNYLHHDSLTNVAVASFVSGASTSLLTSPMAIIKTKQQITMMGFRQTVVDTFGVNRSRNSTTAKAWLRGISNFYIGFRVHFTCDAIGTAVYFTSYEFLKREIARRKPYDDGNNTHNDNHLSLPERMICAAASGMICWSIIFPYDVLRSRLYYQSLSNRTQSTAFQIANDMIRKEGMRSLYRGVGVTVARAGPVAAVVLPVYDCVLSWLSR
jgi:hypothetical protein